MNNIKKIHAFGDSFVSGDQDDFKHDHHPRHPSVLGHQKIASWLINNVDWTQ